MSITHQRIIPIEERQEARQGSVTRNVAAGEVGLSNCGANGRAWKAWSVLIFGRYYPVPPGRTLPPIGWVLFTVAACAACRAEVPRWKPGYHSDSADRLPGLSSAAGRDPGQRDSSSRASEAGLSSLSPLGRAGRRNRHARTSQQLQFSSTRKIDISPGPAI